MSGIPQTSIVVRIWDVWCVACGLFLLGMGFFVLLAAMMEPFGLGTFELDLSNLFLKAGIGPR